MKTWLLLGALVFGFTGWAQEAPPAEGIPQVAVNVVVMQISPEVAAAWGLDGGPPASPKSTPLGRPIPRLLSPADVQTVFTALRQQPKTQLIGLMTLVVLSGREGRCAAVMERRMPTAYETRQAPDKAAGNPGTPDYGEARGDLGVTLTVTPQVTADGQHIAMSLHPKVVRFLGADTTWSAQHKTPKFAVWELESEIVLPNGHTMLLTGLKHPLHEDEPKTTEAGLPTDAPVLIWISAEVVRPVRPAAAVP